MSTYTLNRNLGFIANMNHLERDPKKDTDFVPLTKADEAAWYEGYDECNAEYAKYEKTAKNKP